MNLFDTIDTIMPHQLPLMKTKVLRCKGSNIDEVVNEFLKEERLEAIDYIDLTYLYEQKGEHHVALIYKVTYI